MGKRKGRRLSDQTFETGSQLPPRGNVDDPGRQLGGIPDRNRHQWRDLRGGSRFGGATWFQTAITQSRQAGRAFPGEKLTTSACDAALCGLGAFGGSAKLSGDKAWKRSC